MIYIFLMLVQKTNRGGDFPNTKKKKNDRSNRGHTHTHCEYLHSQEHIK